MHKNVLNKAEQPMVDITYELLSTKGEPLIYEEIMNFVAQKKGFTEEEAKQMIAQLYTEVNIDGRFVCVGRNLWGLKKWFPLDQTTDSAIAANVKEDDDALEAEMEEDLNELEDEFLTKDED